MHRTRNALACLAVLSVAATQAAAQTAWTAPSTHLSIEPAAGFTPAGGFVGLESLQHQTAVMFMELPGQPGGGAVEELNQKYTAELLAARGMKMESKAIGKHEGLPSLTIKASMSKDGVDYVQWLFMFESPEPRLGQVVVTSPKAEFAKIESQVVKMLASVKWTAQEAKAEAAYNLTLPPGWKLAKQSGPLDLYTSTGRFPKPPEDSAFAVLMLADQPQDFAAYVRERNLKRNNFTGLRELESVAVKIDGHPANISYVTGQDTRAGKPVTLQYCYIQVDGRVLLFDSQQTPQFGKAEFEKVVKSWRPKTTAKP